MATIVFDTYGKTRVRLTCVQRKGNTHELRELMVRILFTGDYGPSFTAADNSQILPTDTMKNTVYAVARQNPIVSIEQFALDLADRFLSQVSVLKQVEIYIEETPWQHIGSHESSFMQTGNERRTTTCGISRTSQTFVAGIANLQILKTSNSAFAGFLKDDFTTLTETDDRLLGTMLSADWTYVSADLDFNHSHAAVRANLLEVFANHVSKSVQHTLFAMAEAALSSFSFIAEIHLTMPNKHCLLVDLSKFGLDNPNQIFVPIDEPSGYIEARVRR
jgi:urate oxidase